MPVPFPADNIGKPKAPSGASPSGASPSDKTPALSDRVPGAGRTGDNRSVTDQKADGDRQGDTPGSSVLDTGRQAVRQAMAATNNWFARTVKSDSAAKPEPGAAGTGTTERPSYSPGDRRAAPSFTPSSTQPQATSGQAPASAGPTGYSQGAAGRPGSSYYQNQSPYSGSQAPQGSRYPGAPGGAGSGAGTSNLASGAAAVVSGAAAGVAEYASSVSTAWQNRNAAKRRRHGTVRRSPRRQAQLTLARVEPWSVMKFSFVVSVVAFIIMFVAVAVLFWVLSSLGVFTSLEHNVSTITGSKGVAGTNISGWFSASRILGWTAGIGALNIVLITAMSTVGSVIYNLIARTIGGIEVTFRETD